MYLGDVECVVEIAEGVEFPLLTVHGNVELLDTLKSELIALHKDAHGSIHETLGDLECLRGHGGGEKSDLVYISIRTDKMGGKEHEVEKVQESTWVRGGRAWKMS